MKTTRSQSRARGSALITAAMRMIR